jgi:hypothetical protein
METLIKWVSTAPCYVISLRSQQFSENRVLEHLLFMK